jgi:multidrug efflux pump subunit AcrA (membrane-fusion protein)
MSKQELDQAVTVVRSMEATLKAIDEQIRQQKNELGYSPSPPRPPASSATCRCGNGRSHHAPDPADDHRRQHGARAVICMVSVQDCPKVKLGQTVYLLDDYRRHGGDAEGDFISPAVDDATQTVLVKTPIAARGDCRPRSRQFVRARLIWSVAPALTVPLVSGLTRISGQYFVFVAEAGPGGGLVAKQKPVVGRCARGHTTTGDRRPEGRADRVIVGGVPRRSVTARRFSKARAAADRPRRSRRRE